MAIKQVTPKNFSSLKESSKKQKILVAVLAPGCQYCDQSKPILRQLADQWKEGRVGYVDAGIHEALADQIGATAYPYFVLYSSGMQIGKELGLMSLQELQAFVRK